MVKAMVKAMDNVIFFSNQEAFYEWLEEHHGEAREIWVGYYRKSTGRGSITWSTSVDAALCFGWIDGIRKTIDEESYKIRFTPRKPKSMWSAVNVKKVQHLIQLEKMRPEGMALFNLRNDSIGYSTEDRNIELTNEYESHINANHAAWVFFTNLAPSYRKTSIWWVMSAKKEETRIRRLGILIASSEQGQMIPMLRKK
jgi:uncharacterized protein YdeI (YjbR/CyaY-like superfamily)